MAAYLSPSFSDACTLHSFCCNSADDPWAFPLEDDDGPGVVATTTKVNKPYASVPKPQPKSVADRPSTTAAGAGSTLLLPPGSTNFGAGGDGKRLQIPKLLGTGKGNAGAGGQVAPVANGGSGQQQGNIKVMLEEAAEKKKYENMVGVKVWEVGV